MPTQEIFDNVEVEGSQDNLIEEGTGGDGKITPLLLYDQGEAVVDVKPADGKEEDGDLDDNVNEVDPGDVLGEPSEVKERLNTLCTIFINQKLCQVYS